MAGAWVTAIALGLSVLLQAGTGAAAASAESDGYQRLAGHGGPVKGVAVSPDGRRALTASFDYAVGHWDLAGAEPRLIRWLDGHEAAANVVRFHPDGARAVSAGDDFDIIVWDLVSGEMLQRLEGHRGKVLGLDIAPDGRTLASAGWDGRIGLWDLETGASIRWLDGHRANVNDVLFSADGGTLWSASYDGTIRAWPVAGGEPEELVSHGFGVNHLVVDEARGHLVYGALDGAVRVIDLATGAELADLTADRRPILALARSADGGAIAVGDGEGYIMIIETEGWSISRDFRAAVSGPIWALDWVGPDRLLAAGLANEAAIWPVSAAGAPDDALFADGTRHFQTPPGEMTNGERQFVRKCSVCHTLEPDGARRAGPTLFGLFGRRAGSVDGYSYSDALSGSGIVWTDETIHRLFEEGPAVFTPGSKMPMQRIQKAKDRADLIAFLKQHAGRAGRSK